MGSTAKPAPKKTNTLTELVSWFEIPAYDLGRAKAFYDHLYGIAMETSFSGDHAMAFFPVDKGGGAIVQGPGCIPNDCGTLVYLNAGNDLDGMLARVEAGGGRIIMGKSLISESAGCFALFIDSEGNRMALHAAAEAPQKSARAGTTPKSPARKGAAKKPVSPNAGKPLTKASKSAARKR